MCAVSAMYDYGRQLPEQWWRPQQFYKYQELIKKAEEWDRMANQPDCEDSAKAEWMKAIEERMRKLEQGTTCAESSST